MHKNSQTAPHLFCNICVIFSGHAQGQQLRRTNNSASQTLSDLAAAASNQLMAENAAAAAAAASGKTKMKQSLERLQ